MRNLCSDLKTNVKTRKMKVVANVSKLKNMVDSLNKISQFHAGQLRNVSQMNYIIFYNLNLFTH
jgi:hypothetical protein